jgi:hypothetical protein
VDFRFFFILVKLLTVIGTTFFSLLGRGNNNGLSG